MIEPKAASRLVWAGPATVEQIAENLQARRRTVVKLPASYHHALSMRLFQSTRARGVMDLSGDARLLERIAALDGLDSLRALVEPMQEEGARVRLRSPFPHLFFYQPVGRPRSTTNYHNAGGALVKTMLAEVSEAA